SRTTQRSTITHGISPCYPRPPSANREENMVRAYVLITATAGKALEVVNALQGQDGVLQADAITGEYDVIAQVEAPDVPGIVRLRRSATLRHSLWLWAGVGLVSGEALTIAVAVAHGAQTVPVVVAAMVVWWALITAVIVGGAAMLTRPSGEPVDVYGVPNGLTALRAYL